MLVCPVWQVSRDHFNAKRTGDDETLQVVLIDFGMAVEIMHPSASDWLQRDLEQVRNFFIKQGIKTLSNEDAEEFVTDPFDESNDVEDSTEMTEHANSSNKGLVKDDKKWRHNKQGWDDDREMQNLFGKLRGGS